VWDTGHGTRTIAFAVTSARMTTDCGARTVSVTVAPVISYLWTTVDVAQQVQRG
jgi:hypothetical protein